VILRKSHCYNIARNAGFDKTSWKRICQIAEIPFDSRQKVHDHISSPTAPDKRNAGRVISFTKGAIDMLAGKSSNILTSDGLRPIDAEEIYRHNERMAADGLRVIALL